METTCTVVSTEAKTVAARDWVPLEDPGTYTAVTAYTADDELDAIAAQLRAEFAEYHDGEITDLEEYLREQREQLRDEEREKLIQITAQLRSESAALAEQESVLTEHLAAVRDRIRQLTAPRDTQIRAMSAFATTRDLGALADISHTAVRKILGKAAAGSSPMSRGWPAFDLERHVREHEEEMRRLEALRASIAASAEEQKGFIRKLARENTAAGLPVPEYAAQLLAEDDGA
jgi:small-conductance mechanosensitive channel